ncbi:hypothetical protein ABBQ32_010881 [Trebouxia sp. C0010 RCD-2024]
MANASWFNIEPSKVIEADVLEEQQQPDSPDWQAEAASQAEAQQSCGAIPAAGTVPPFVALFRSNLPKVQRLAACALLAPACSSQQDRGAHITSAGPVPVLVSLFEGFAAQSKVATFAAGAMSAFTVLLGVTSQLCKWQQQPYCALQRLARGFQQNRDTFIAASAMTLLMSFQANRDAIIVAGGVPQLIALLD